MSVDLPQFEAIQTTTVNEEIYLRLREALMNGEFAPGQSLTIRGLAGAFGTSTMPVRNSVNRLIAEQALEMRSARKISVPAHGVSHLKQLRDMRMLIEGDIAGSAANNITGKALSELSSLKNKMLECTSGLFSENDPLHALKQYLKLNRQFLFTVYEAAEIPLAIPIIESLWLQSGPYLPLLYRSSEGDTRPSSYPEISDAYRGQMIEGLSTGNRDIVTTALKKDIYATADILIQLCAENPL